MTFHKKEKNTDKLADNIMDVAELAQQAKLTVKKEDIVDVSLGSLLDDQEEMVIFDSFYNEYRKLENKDYASYSNAKGNHDYLDIMMHWVLDDRINLPHDAIASAGASGAIAMTLDSTLKEGDSVVLPSLTWDTYHVFTESKNLNTIEYELFDGNSFNIAGFKSACYEAMNHSDKLFIIINDPLQNPSGYTLSLEEWHAIISFINTCAAKMPVILLNDIAYLDYAETGKEYLDLFNTINDNVLVTLTYSLSKSFTAYGLRAGLAINITKDQTQLEHITNVMEKYAASSWNNAPTGVMIAAVNTLKNNKEQYLKELQDAKDMLATRLRLVNKNFKLFRVPLYPTQGGFFITVKIPDEFKRDVIHRNLLHKNVYTIKQEGGLRIALCSLPKNKIKVIAIQLAYQLA